MAKAGVVRNYFVSFGADYRCVCVCVSEIVLFTCYRVVPGLFEAGERRLGSEAEVVCSSTADLRSRTEYYFIFGSPVYSYFVFGLHSLIPFLVFSPVT